MTISMPTGEHTVSPEKIAAGPPGSSSIGAAGAASGALRTVLPALLVGALALAAMMRNGMYEDPVTLWKNTAERAPHTRRSLHNYATALIEKGEQTGDAGLYWQALRELQSVLLMPDDGSVPAHRIFSTIGRAYYQFDMVEEAIRAWKDGLRSVPDQAELHANVAYALVRLGRFDEARGHALAAREADPLLAEAANTLGLIYLQAGNYREAAELFVQFQALRPEEAYGYWNAALAFEKDGRYSRSREMARMYLARETDPERRAAAESFVNDLGRWGPNRVK